MTSRRPTWAILIWLLTLTVVIPGCGGNGGSGTEAGGDSPSAPPAARNDINPVDRDRLADGGTLTLSLDQFPPTFNVGHIDGALADTSSVMGALLPRPFVFDAAAQPLVNKDYLVSAELTATEPQQVITYRINPKASWYDGAPITVADFQAHWKAHNGTNPAYKVVSTQGYDKIREVAQGADKGEVIVTFAQPYADWQALFSGLYPASTNRDPALFNEGWREKPLTTAGPFRLESIDRTAQTITLVPNERWWGRPPKLDRIVFRAIDPDAQIDALANGEIDAVDIASDANKLRRAQRLRGIAIRKAGGPDFSHLTFNGTSAALSDVNVRRALALAVNRQAITKAILGPLDLPTTPLGNHIFMANQKGYRDNSGVLGRPDPQRAQTLLEEAGWKRNGGTIRTKGGQELSLRLVIPSGAATSRQVAELIQGMLGEAGAKVAIDAVPLNDFFIKYVNSGNFDLTLFGWVGTPFPISPAKSIYAKPKPGPNGELEVGQNYARIGSDEIDRLFDQATTELDREAAVALANQIDAKIWAQVHSLPFYQRPEIVATKETLANFGAFGFASGFYEDVGFTKR